MSPTLTVETPTEGAGRSARRPRALLAVAAVVLVLLVAFGVRWWTHPTVFGNLGDEFEKNPAPVAESALSTTVVFPQLSGEVDTLRIDDARAILSENSARASATFWVCHQGPGDEVFLAADDAADSCADRVPLEPGTSFSHDVGREGDYLFVTLTPTRPGVTRLQRVELDYRRGAAHLFQGGTESIRVVRQLTAR